MNAIKWIKLTVNTFNDEKIRLIEQMPEGDTILIIWIKLLTQAGKTNENGYIFLSENIPYTDEMLCTLFNRPISTIRLALRTLQGFEMISIDTDHFISINNWDKHQNIEGMQKIRNQTRERVARHRDKQRHAKDNEDVTLHVTQGNATELELELEEELDIDSNTTYEKQPNDKKKPSPKSKKPTYDVDNEFYKMAIYFKDLILKNNPKFKQPNYQTWADDFRKIVELDKRTKTDVKQVMDFVQSDSFEMVNVLSPGKLRKRFDNLYMKSGNAPIGIRKGAKSVEELYAEDDTEFGGIRLYK